MLKNFTDAVEIVAQNAVKEMNVLYIVKSSFFLYAKLEKCGKIYALLCINQYGGIV